MKVLRTDTAMEGTIVLSSYNVKIVGLDYYELCNFVSNFDKWVYKYTKGQVAWFSLDEEGKERKIISIPSWWIEDGYDEKNIK